MAIISIKDIELNRTENNFLDLSIRLSCDGLSFSLFHHPQQKYVLLMHYPELKTTAEQIAFIDNENEYFGTNYRSVKVLFDTANSLITPAALYLESRKEDMFRLSFSHADNVSVLACHLKKTDNYMLFGVDSSLYRCIRHKFPNAVFMTTAACLIDNTITRLRLNNEKPEYSLFTEVHSDYIDLVLAHNDRLILFNTFRYKTPNDMVYYILNVFDQYKIDTEKAHLIFSGEIATDNLAVIQLRKFIRFVFFESRNSSFNYHYKFQDLAAHRFYQFLSVARCE